MKHAAPLIALGILLLAVVTGVGTASSLITIDDGHGLNSSDKINEFEQTGSAQTDIQAPRMTLTVSKECDASDCGYTTLDTRNDYIHVNYKENITREFRLFIPAEYMGVVSAVDREGLQNGTEADFRIAEQNGEVYLVMQFTMDSAGNESWAIGEGETAFTDLTRMQSERIETISGVGLSTDEWQYIKSDDIDDAAYLVASNASDPVIVEYQVNYTEEGQEKTRWIRAPYDKSDDHPLYVNEREDEYYIIPTEDGNPRIRFKDKPSFTDRLLSSGSEVTDFATKDLWDMIPFI